MPSGGAGHKNKNIIYIVLPLFLAGTTRVLMGYHCKTI
jgi:hypothetical protein